MYDARDPDSVYPQIQPLVPPAGAPNVLVIMLDDVGFGASSTFGGPIETATFDRLADNGLRYSRFHTTALCSPTRMALLTGRNHHSVGMGAIVDMATSAPGASSIRPNSKATLPEILRMNGYSTAQFGKCHEVPVWETSPVGPFDRWPTGSGFEHFYGFVAAETSSYFPALYDGTTPIDQKFSPEEGYHLTEDIADNAIQWIRQQKSLTPDQPFFMYFAPGATHAPHHAPRSFIDKYKGKFDAGWDVLRRTTLERQKAIGVVPHAAALTERNEGIPAWEDIPPHLRPVLIRQMEVYAGFLEHTDHQAGRIVDAIEDMGELENTIVIAIIGDNGASAEGGPYGTFHEYVSSQGLRELESDQSMIDSIELLGGPEAFGHYSVGWAHAMNTPYQWTKQVASHFGGTRNGLVVHWPSGITSAGEIRDQFCHVIDIAPTVMEAVGIPEPTFVNGVQQSPIEGTSMLYTLSDSDAPGRHETQYFEMVGNRGIYHHGWTAVTKHRTPWDTAGTAGQFDDDVWELYNTSVDWSQANNVANEYPERLAYLQRLWLIEAVKHNVLPLDDRFMERHNSDLAGRPTLVAGTTQTLYKGMGRLNENAVLNLKNKSHRITAEIDVTRQDVSGPIIAQGGAHGGWALYARSGELRYEYNLLGFQRYRITAPASYLTTGLHVVEMNFTYDGGGLGNGGSVEISLDGTPVGSGRVEKTVPFFFSVYETTDVGFDAMSPVTNDYGVMDGKFTGVVNWVRLEAMDDAPQEAGEEAARQRFRIAMAHQ